MTPRVIGHAPCVASGHALVLVSRRSWWAPWRRTLALRCWRCALRVELPRIPGW